MLIDGTLTKSEEKFGVINPSSGEVFAHAPHATQAQVDEAVAAAKKAFRSWQAVPLSERKLAMAKVKEAYDQHRDELADLLVREQGKPLASAKGEVAGAAGLMKKAIELTVPPEVYSDTATRRIEVVRKPIGVVAAITPWNFPIFCSVAKFAPAIVLGNTVVWKPSPFTPLTALRMGEILQSALPPGVLNVVTGDDKQRFNVGAHLTSHAGVSKVSFTGSVPTGKKIMSACSSDVKRVTLEMGGNDAAIVRKDVDVKAMAPKVFSGAFNNSGQICCAVKRCFVHEDIFDEFKEELVRCAEKATFGDGFEVGVEYGPLNNKMQLDKVSALVEDARAQGCEVLCGGGRREGSRGFFYEPTIVSNIKEGRRCPTQEQFGPVMPITPYKSDEEAVARANDSEYGLGGSVWTSDFATGNALASKLLAGTVWVNQHTDLTEAPFGGFKQSGLGREFGSFNVASFTEVQTLSLAKQDV
ncbi:putative aldehyde dehydrogenase [Emiliania huxleyi CCMP1516]|uniref:Aldehyde dehydrogenase domain-containing protein n=2 Tax=Emiliania huxleyi TaxID=2903 RepID=A0A0D3L2E7_EMIH1|nr:putative aldehyde dehydrogenase [Emiliania huxleyi CCMP1516]EOD42182.1 putative aldehyde dehydrogenase [Emiliania huxleyi CCMP1516]|eukprot:XP_005794611.1 putative aldehyde dehydrogenase [Emiliania huxleyi CCMP1516]